MSLAKLPHNSSRTIDAMTIEYFEVLRHLKVNQRLADVQECLFVPLMMSVFDHKKILRWREFLAPYIFDRKLKKGFEAIERIENDYEGSDLPEGKFADDNIEYLEGYVYLKFQLARPKDNDEDEFEESFWGWAAKLLPYISPSAFHKKFIKEQEEKDANFQKELAPKIAEAFVQHLRVNAITDDGTEQSIEIPMDATLVSAYKNNRSLYVSLRVEGELPLIKRSAVKYIELCGDEYDGEGNYIPLSELLPADSRVVVKSGSMNYRTKHISTYLFRNSRIQNDLTGMDKVRIYTPLNRQELRNPRNEDLELANTLQDHLNDNMEFFHKAIWMNMSAERRFMFLDGIQVKDYSEVETYPDGVLRSVASVVENRVIGVAGNSLVMPVAPGFRLDPNVRGKEIDFLSLYQPLTPIEPMSISIPTKGVFAEAVMGKCNSCEIKEENRFWRWSEEPIPDSPTSILPVSTDSRRTDPGNLTPSELPNPVVNIQNAPNLPNPNGFDVAGNLLGTSSFNDITGLDGNQKNAIEALKASFETSKSFGEGAAKLAALGAQLNAIKKAKENNQLNNGKANELTEKAINKSIDTTGDDGNIEGHLSQLKKIKEMVDQDILTPEAGDAISKGIIDKITKGGLSSVLDMPSIQDRISNGDSLEFQGDGESISIEKPNDAVAQPTNLIKFMINFRRPDKFRFKNGNLHDFGGHFGFDWIREEYFWPMTNIVADNDGTAIGANQSLCKNITTMQQLYLDGVNNKLKPHGIDYYPAWLSLFPYASTEEAKAAIPTASVMHKHGARLTLELEQFEELVESTNEIEFKVDASVSNFLTITPSKISVNDFIKKGKKVQREVLPNLNVKKTYWVLEDAVTVKCENGVLNNHTEIKVMAKGSDKEEQVGQLMVYANSRIPKANIVLVELVMENENVSLPSDIKFWLKNRSFNQALIRAEVDVENKFKLKDLPQNADVQNFISNYKGKPITDNEQFRKDLFALYEKYGKYKPEGGTIEGAANNKTYLFITNLQAGAVAGAASLVETKDAAGNTTGWNWGNAVAIFQSGLNDINTVLHEVGHSLGLSHVQEDPDASDGAPEFYQGFTDNVMDYEWRIRGLVDSTDPSKGVRSGGANKYTGNMFYFFKWQWDKMRTDGSMEG